MEVSKSECNSYVPTNVITELKYDEHIESSVSVKGANYFNIFECGRNLSDQLDVTHQRAFTASAKPSSVPKGHYEPSPAREIFYDLFVDVILDKNYGIDEDEVRKAVDYMKSEYEEEHERNIKDMNQDGDYKSPWKNKDATVATGLRTVTYSSNSNKKPASRKEPIKDTQTIKEPIKGSHLGKIVCHSIDGPTDMDPVVTGFSIIGQGGYRTISGGIHTQSIVQGGENINCSDVITHVLTNSGELTLKSDYFLFDPLKAETLMIATLNEPFLESDGYVRSTSIIGASRPN